MKKIQCQEIAEPWAAELRLHVAMKRREDAELRTVASEFLSHRPDASGRLLAGQALGMAEAFEEASDVLAPVAHDLNAPPMVRANAFALLLHALADQNTPSAWRVATREWDAWSDLSRSALDRSDDRVSAWQVRIAHHASQASN